MQFFLKNGQKSSIIDKNKRKMAERGIFGKIKSVSGVCTLSKEKD